MEKKNKKQPNQFSGLSGLGRRAYDTKAGRRVSAGVGGVALIGGLLYAAQRTELGRSLIARAKSSISGLRRTSSEDAVVSYAGDETEDSFV